MFALLMIRSLVKRQSTCHVNASLLALPPPPAAAALRCCRPPLLLEAAAAPRLGKTPPEVGTLPPPPKASLVMSARFETAISSSVQATARG